MEPPRPVEEFNSVVVAASVVVGGGGRCGPQLGRAHGLLSSLQIREAISHLSAPVKPETKFFSLLSKTKTLKQNLFFFFELLFLFFRALQNVFGCKRFWRKRITRNWIFCDGVVISQHPSIYRERGCLGISMGGPLEQVLLHGKLFLPC
jgi:hypothetical protein